MMSKVDWSKAPQGAEWWAHGTWWRAGEGKKEFSYHIGHGWCPSDSQFSSKLADNYEPRPDAPAPTVFDWNKAPFWATCAGIMVESGTRVWVSLDGWCLCTDDCLPDEQISHDRHNPFPVELLEIDPRQKKRVQAIEHHLHVTGGVWNFEQGYEIKLANECVSWIEFEAHKFKTTGKSSRVALTGRAGFLGEAPQPDLTIPDENELVTAADFLSAGLEILTDRGGEYGTDGRECSFPQAAEAFNAITGHNLKGSDICLILALVKQVRQYAQPKRFHVDSGVDGVNYLALQSQELKKERQ